MILNTEMVHYRPGIQAQDNADLVEVVSLFSHVPGSIWGIIWVHTLHLAIVCVRLGGTLTPPSFSYLKVARLAGFLFWVSVLSPQFTHLVCPLTT